MIVGNVALAVVYAALESVDKNGAGVAIKDVLNKSRAKIAA